MAIFKKLATDPSIKRDERYVIKPTPKPAPAPTPAPTQAQAPKPAPVADNGLDQDAVRLAKAIRQHESGGNFNAKGASGENGGYQFMPDTWKAGAQKYLGDANAAMTPDNQNQVAYKQIKEWKDQGYKPDQIASLWNSGKPDYAGKVGVNKFGVKYDVPSYVRSVGGIYRNLKMNEPVPAAQAATVDQGGQPTPPTQEPEKKNILDEAADTVNRAYDAFKNAPVIKQAGEAYGAAAGAFAAPIAGATGALMKTATNAFNVPTTRAEAERIARGERLGLFEGVGGQAVKSGGEGFDFLNQAGKEAVPAFIAGGAGKLIQAPLTAAQIYQGGKDVYQGVKEGNAEQAAAGALSFGTGVLGARGLVKGKGMFVNQEMVEPIKKGFGMETKTKAVSGVTGEKITPMQKAALDKSTKEYGSVFKQNKGQARKNQNASLRGGKAEPNIAELAAREQIPLSANAENRIDTTQGREVVRERMGRVDDMLDTALDSDKSTWYDLDKLERDAHRRIDGMEGLTDEKNAAKARFSEIIGAERQKYGSKITGQQAQRIKRGLQKAGFPNGNMPEGTKAIRSASELVKTAIEEHYQHIAPIKKINEVLGNYIALDRALESVHGNAVPGSTFGKLFRRGMGAAVGTGIGNTLGLGWLGALAGDQIAGKVSDFIDNPSRKTAKASARVEKAGIGSMADTDFSPTPQADRVNAEPVDNVIYAGPSRVPVKPAGLLEGAVQSPSGPFTPARTVYNEAHAKMVKNTTGKRPMSSVAPMEGSKIVKGANGQHYLIRPGYQPSRLGALEVKTLQRAGYTVENVPEIKSPR